MTDALDRGLDAFGRGDWTEAHRLLVAATDIRSADALESLATAAYMVGDEPTSDRAWERAVEQRTRSGDLAGAARCAFWLGFLLLLRGTEAPASGWLAKAERLASSAEGECSARGWVLVPVGFLAVAAGDVPKAEQAYAEAIRIALRVGDRDLLAVARLGTGEVLIAGGDVATGLRLLDEVMVDVVSGVLSPIPTGIVYCAVIDACMKELDLVRAAEWTEAMSRWSEEQPELVAFRGTCLVHRAQILQAHGDWLRATREVARAMEVFARHPNPAAGAAHYLTAEMHRVVGELDEAEVAYRAAASYGIDATPGLALLRLAEGRASAAADAARRMLAQTDDPMVRPSALTAAAEILIAVGDVEAAEAAVVELEQVVERSNAALLRGTALRARGALAMAAGDPVGALVRLRGSRRRWIELAMPYEAARTDTVIAAACRAAGDPEAADLADAAAASTFRRLGADPAVAALPLVRPVGPASDTVLSARECDVLRLVAAGGTNRSIGSDLGLSEHTVARHLQNIFTKIGVSSRAAATAWAYEHDVL